MYAEDHYYTERMKYKDELEDVKENLDEKYEEAQQGENILRNWKRSY